MRKRVLIACEESQVECMAFREYGCEAYSCDLKPTSGPVSEWHLHCDVREVINLNWDLIIAHPPCTFLSLASANSMFRNGRINQDRYEKMLEAREFFMFFYNLPGKVCIENPRPLKIAQLPVPSQVISPHEFGADYSKRTYLWLHNLSPLMGSSVCCNPLSWTAEVHGSEMRSKSFPEIAYAMAREWSD